MSEYDWELVAVAVAFVAAAVACSWLGVAVLRDLGFES